MTNMGKAIAAFWVVVIGMLLWQFFSYNRGAEEQDATAQEKHYIFLPNAPAAKPPPPPPSAKADVQQTRYYCKEATPAEGLMTCYVTLTNKGRSKATDVQVLVRPFRGASNEDADVGVTASGTISDTDPAAQISQWVSFPDLDPGQSSTQTVSFMDRHYTSEGPNANPQILFKSAPAH